MLAATVSELGFRILTPGYLLPWQPYSDNKIEHLTLASEKKIDVQVQSFENHITSINPDDRFNQNCVIMVFESLEED